MSQIQPYQPSMREVMTLDQCLAGWLAAKQGKSGSNQTLKAYRETLLHFRNLLQQTGRDLDADPGMVAPLAQGWAATFDPSRRNEVAPSTYNQRLAILSSFYVYAIKHEVLSLNPIERVERRNAHKKDAARHLPLPEIQESLASIDRSTLEGMRDYVLLAIAFETGKRVAELAGLRYGHLTKQGSRCHVFFVRCKGGKKASCVLPPKLTKALYDYLYEVYGQELGRLPADTPIWISFSDRNKGKAIGTRTIQRICETYLGTSKAHTTRHSWAVMMHKDKKATLAEIGRGLGHSHLKTTSDYLEDLLNAESPYEAGLEDLLGID